MADMSEGARRSWQRTRRHDQIGPAPSTALVVSAIWWAFMLHAALSVLLR